MPDDASKFIELLTGDAATTMCWRTFPDDKAHKRPGVARNHVGALSMIGGKLSADNADRWGVFTVVNAGGHDDASITEYRALFIDGDDIPMPDVWHMEPDFLVIRDADHWHAYWLLLPGVIRDQWLNAMRRLAIHYGTDPIICNSSRVMRVPGFNHHKNAPMMITLQELRSAECSIPRALEELTVDLPALPERVRSHRTGEPVTRAALEEMLAHIDPECDRKTWLSVAGGLMNANVITTPGGPADDTFDGLDMFTKWSAGDYTDA